LNSEDDIPAIDGAREVQNVLAARRIDRKVNVGRGEGNVDW
jgi:hypothetical protein